MSEGEFWNNLDGFVEQQSSGGKTIEKVGDWLKNIPEPDNKEQQPKSKNKSMMGKQATSDYEGASKTNPKPERKSKKQVSIDAKETKKEKQQKLTVTKKDDLNVLSPRKYNRKSKTRRKRKRQHDSLYFGPLIECNDGSYFKLWNKFHRKMMKKDEDFWWKRPSVIYAFNLPRVALQLEKLMGSSVVRLTDRKYMLDLQKRMQEDYHDTLMKRISQRQASELEREKRMGLVGSEKYPKMISEHPVFIINQKTNNLLMSKRDKLKTVREKNAERLIKQGKRWERERMLFAEQERMMEISTKKEREKMLEDQTLYIFDPSKFDTSQMEILKIKNRKFTECEIDLKDFLLSERDNMKKRMMAKAQSSEESKKTDESKKEEVKAINPINDISDEKPVTTFEEPRRIELELNIQISSEELKKKQAKKDEDPRIAKFKEAETVKEIYQLAEELIAGDGKKKLLKQIKQLKKALNLSMIKGAQ